MIYKVTGWLYEFKTKNTLIPLQTEFEDIEIKNIEEKEKIYNRAETEILKINKTESSLTIDNIVVWQQNIFGFWMPII